MRSTPGVGEGAIFAQEVRVRPSQSFASFAPMHLYTGLCAARVGYCRYRQVKDQILPRCPVLRVELDGAQLVAKASAMLGG